MSDYAWFKLVVRAIGLLLLGMALPSLIWQVGTIVALAFDSQLTQFQPMYFIQWVPGVLGTAAQLAFGLYLLLGAERLIARCLRDVRGHCACCGYDLSSLTADKCPECGTPITPAAPRSPAP
ncbi:MAG: hypothetical protein WD749_07010 [Phycisphaerales bacterium]